jgi:hypothetical protein
VIGEVGFLCAYGYPQLAADLLETMIAQRGREPESLLALARCVAATGEHARAFDLVGETEARVDAAELATMAERAKRWDVVEGSAAEVVSELEVDSGDARDVWEWRAVVAAAAAVRGDHGAREHFRAAAPRHVRAWRRLVAIERAAGLAEHESDLEHLRALAPGAAVLREGGPA